jgi:hypothetical protein
MTLRERGYEGILAAREIREREVREFFDALEQMQSRQQTKIEEPTYTTAHQDELRRVKEKFSPAYNATWARRAELLFPFLLQLRDPESAAAHTVRVRRTTEYDDYCNGVDAVAELQRGDGVQALPFAVDVSSADADTDQGAVKSCKFLSQARNRNELARLDYYQRAPGEAHGPEENVYGVCVAFAPEDMEEFAAVAMQAQREQNPQAILQHPLRTDMFRQMREGISGILEHISDPVHRGMISDADLERGHAIAETLDALTPKTAALH